MGQEPSDDQSGVAAELGTDHAVLCLPGRDSQGDLYDQCSGVAEYEFAQDHQDAGLVPQRGSGVATALDGITEPFQEMEFRAELAGGAESLPDSVAGANAGAGARVARDKDGKNESLKAHQREQRPRSTPEPPVSCVESQNRARRQ